MPNHDCTNSAIIRTGAGRRFKAILEIEQSIGLTSGFGGLVFFQEEWPTCLPSLIEENIKWSRLPFSHFKERSQLPWGSA
jgi:hypothetical protein